MSILDQIITQKKKEIQELSNVEDAESYDAVSFLSTLEEKRLHLIAEVKHASPSKGIIYKNFNPIELAKTFESSGASCISVLTDEVFFKGHNDYLTAIKKEVKIPVLRKDFIIDPLQVIETKRIGADIMLLILDILETNQANELISVASSLNLEVLIEIHSPLALKKLENIKIKPIVGINNRDLNTFTLDTNRAIEQSHQIKKMDKKIKIIAESGYSEVNQMSELDKNNINGVLIGEGLSKNKKLLDWFKNEN